MEHTKKMLLIEPEAVERFQRPIKTNNPLSSLDIEMEKILKSTDNDYEKWKMYQQTLQRYLHFTSMDRKPVQIPMVDLNSPNDEDTAQQNYEKPVDKDNQNLDLRHLNDILKYIPKSYHNRSVLVVKTLQTNSDRITWDKKGVVTIDGKVIHGSNITDLIGDIVRPLKRNEPIGCDKFLNLLFELNLPMECIGNPKRSEYIHKLHINKYKGHLSKTPTSEIKIPQKSLEVLNEFKRKRAHYKIESDETPKFTNTTQPRRKLNWEAAWEKWTP